MIEINLLPRDTINEKTTARLEKGLKIGVIVWVGISIIFSAGLFTASWLAARDVAAQEDSIIKIQTELAQSADFVNSLNMLAAKSQGLVAIFKVQPRYSRLLDAFSAKVPPEIRITEVTALSPIKLTVSGTASSYLSLSKFLKALGSDTEGIFTDVTLSNVVLDSLIGQMRFTMEVAIKENSLTHEL